jgi:3',5'-cyclic AMP phosphodiesterase CpdA
MKRIILLSLILFALCIHIPIPAKSDTTSNEFVVWLVTDPHIGSTSYGYTDKYVFQDAIQDSENDWSFDWDIAFVLGDLTDNGYESEYQNFSDAFSVLTKHNRSDFYCLAGNHDSRNDDGSLFRKYVDPLGENTTYSGVNNSQRKFSVENVTATGDSYTVRVGNVLFIVMSPDWNNDDYYNFTWWRSIVENASDDVNIICLSHHWVEGCGIGGGPVSGMENSAEFASWLENHTGRISAWFCGHEHWDYDAGEVYISTAWGTTFIDACSIDDGGTTQTASKSIVLIFEEGNATVRVGDYYHGLSTFNYLNGTEQWDTTDPCRGNTTFTLLFSFSLDPTPPPAGEDTEYFDIASPIDYTGETPPPLGDDTEYFDIAFLLDYTGDNGGGWFMDDSTKYNIMIVAAFAILLPLAVIVKYRNGKVGG